MSTALDQRIDELLGDELEQPAGCPVILEMNEGLAANVVDGLRCALYGGTMATPSRRSLLVLLDAVAVALSNHEEHG